MRGSDNAAMIWELQHKVYPISCVGLNIREVGQSLFERLSWTAFQKKIEHQVLVSSKVSLKTEYYFIFVSGFSCVFQKIDQLCDDYAVYN